MEALAEKIRNNSLDEFKESVRSELNLIAAEPNRLKTYVALLLLGKEIMQVLEGMPMGGMIQQLKEEGKQLAANYLELNASNQLYLFENESVMRALSGGGVEAEFNELNNQVKRLLRQQDDFMRQIIVQREKLGFESIAAKE